MGGKVTIADVAREAGVALGTVSNALNHPERVKAETRALIGRAIERLGYEPNQSARMLAGGSNRMLGLVLPNLKHGISLQIAHGAQEQAARSGFDLLIATSDGSDRNSSRYLSYFLGTQVEGVLVQPQPTLRWKPPAPASAPVVYLDCISTEPGFYVSADHRLQGKLAAGHAIACGARRIAIFGSDELARLGERVTGIAQAVDSHPEISLEFIHEGAWDSPQDGFSIGRRLARRPASERPDFIIALTDCLATGAIEGIKSTGASVPEDIRVAGCDGNPLAWNGSVPLTTAAPSGYEIGRQGVIYLMRIAERLAQGGRAPTRSHVRLVHPFLMPRASSGHTESPAFADPAIDISGYL